MDPTTSNSTSLPSQTLYLNNLNEKIKKNVLKKTLYALFAQFGKVIEIVACRGIKLRGQVFILYLNMIISLFLFHVGMDCISRYCFSNYCN